MKTKMWIGALAVVLVICLGLSIWLLFPGEEAELVEVWSEGELLYSLRLDVNQEVVVQSQNGINVVTVKNGKVAVTEADCPDGYCMARGWCSSGTQIVCLPNRLVLKFVGNRIVDGAVG